MRLRDLNPMQKALLISVGVHILLVAVGLLIHSGIQLPDHSFAEMGFTVTQPARDPVSSTASSAAEPAPETAPPVEPAADEPDESPVDLPKRRMLEQQEPELSSPGHRKLTPGNETTTPVSRPGGSDEKSTTVSPASGEKSMRPSESPPSSVLGDPGSSNTGSGETLRPFFLQGDAADRRIVQQVLPEYPDDLQREARVQLKFTVYPDGRVGRIIPIKKAGPQLENRAINALKQWRFDELTPAQPQNNVTGIITFIFKLQ
ncbi:MAG: energy transducer TonB [candidate division KSB1 bacterium]|nr:energy transducer TonB [candidate division KSB1 bacterium]